jgi:hypothetical protein
MLQLYRTLILISLLALRLTAQAQSIEARASIDTSSLRIGEPLGYTLTVTHAPNLRITWPTWVDTLGQFEVVEPGKIDTSMQGGQVIQRQTLTLMAFDSGVFRIPPVQISYLSPGEGDVRRAQTQGFMVPVSIVPVDTASEIMAIKDIKDDPLTLEEILVNLALGLAILAVIGGIVWLIIRRRKQQPIIPVRVRPQVPPHEIAMQQLSELEQQKHWQKGDIKAYHAGISTILRTYIEGRYQVPAMESVTDEILRDLRPHDVADKQLRALSELLQMADLAKFAKSQPSEKDNLQAMETAREYVRATKLTKEAKEKEAAKQPIHPAGADAPTDPALKS